MHCLVVYTERKRAFIKRRKMHYNEFQAVKLARQLIENEEDDEDDDDGGNDGDVASASISQSVTHETTSSEAASSIHDSGDTGTVHMLHEDVV